MLAFPIAQFAIFYLFVNINSLILAFRQYDYSVGSFAGFGFENFSRTISMFFSEPSYIYSLRNSLIAFFVGTAIGLPLTLFFSYFIYKKMPFHNLFKVLLFMPSILPAIVLVLLFKYFTERAYPEIIYAVIDVDVQGLLENISTTFPTIIFYGLWSGFGVSVIMYVSAMYSINESTVEAAQIDGAGPLREFFSITFPGIYPTFVTFMVISVAAIFTNQLNLYSFFGIDAEIQNYTFGYFLFKELRITPMSGYPYLASIGIVLTLISAPITLLCKHLLEKYGYSQ